MPNKKAYTIRVDGHVLELTNLDKVFWPAAAGIGGKAITKAMEKAGIKAQFIEGMRVAWISDPEGNIVELNQGYADEQAPPPPSFDR